MFLIIELYFLNLKILATVFIWAFLLSSGIATLASSTRNAASQTTHT